MNENYLDHLTKMITDEYSISAQRIIPAKRGFFGETWRLQTDRADYFMKIDYWEYHREAYRKSLPVIDFMTNQGISFIPRIIKTKSGELSCRFNDSVVAIFDFVDGENTEDYPIARLFEYLIHIYKLDSSEIALERETFDTVVLDIFNSLKANIQLPQRIMDELQKKTELISQYAKRLRLFSDICKKDTENFHITHGDAGGNCILHENDFHIIDWDSLKLAPIERDAWFFICDDKQLDAIHTVLFHSGVEYKLNPDRLCYYCYYSFFHYLTEYLQTILFARSEGQKQNVTYNLSEYLTSGWIFNQLQIADRHRIV